MVTLQGEKQGYFSERPILDQLDSNLRRIQDRHGKLPKRHIPLSISTSEENDPHRQVSKPYSYLFNLSTSICKSWCLDTHFFPNESCFVDYITDKQRQ